MGRLSLRVKTLEEFERFKKIAFDEEIAPYLFKDIKQTKLNSEYIKEKDLQNDMVHYILLDNDNDVGIAAGYLLKPINKMIVDIGVLPEHRGNFTKESINEVLNDFYSDDKNKDIQIYGYVRKENERCLKFSKKVGFKIFKVINDNYILRLTHE